MSKPMTVPAKSSQTFALPSARELTPGEMEYLRGCKLMVAMPCYGNQLMATTADSLLKLQAMMIRLNLHLEVHYLYNESLVQRARNALAHTFYDHTDCTHLMFIDADIGFRPDDVLTMLLAKKDVIGGAYPKKQIMWEKVAEAVLSGVEAKHLNHCSGDFVLRTKPGTGGEDINITLPHEVNYVGTGFMLIRRSALDVMAKHLKPYKNNHFGACLMKDTIYPFFDCAIDASNEYLSEDYWFCAKLAELGVPIHFAPWVVLGHFGVYGFQGCLFCSSGSFIHDILKKPSDSQP